MRRSTTPPPSACVFTRTFIVPEADIDELGHANNIAYVRWIQDVAIAHSTSVGFDFAAYRKLGGVFVIRRHEIDYVRPTLRGDQLELSTWLGTATPAKFLRMTRITKQDGALIAEAVTTWGFVDLQKGRPMRVPPRLRDAFGLVIRDTD